MITGAQMWTSLHRASRCSKVLPFGAFSISDFQTRINQPEGSVAGTWLQGGVAGARLIAPPLAPPALQVQGPLGGRHVLTGLAAAHAQVQTTVHPNNHPSPLCDPSSIWRFLSASCAGARWGCVDKKRPLSLIGCSHANPTLSG